MNVIQEGEINVVHIHISLQNLIYFKQVIYL